MKIFHNWVSVGALFMASLIFGLWLCVLFVTFDINCANRLFTHPAGRIAILTIIITTIYATIKCYQDDTTK